MLQDPNVERYVENAIKPLKKEIAKLKLQIKELKKTLRIHDVSGRSEQFSCPLSETKGCDRHKINDEEGCWEFCNTCEREWAR